MAPQDPPTNGPAPDAEIESMRRELLACRARLERTEAHYRGLIQSAPIGIFRSTLDGQFLDINPVMARRLGYDSPAEMLEHIAHANIAETLFVDPEQRKRIVQALNHAGAWHNETVRYRTRDGGEIVANLYIRRVEDQPPYLEGFVEDITERQRAEEELARNEERYRSLFERAQVGIFRVDIERGRISEANASMARILGYDAPEQLYDIDTRDLYVHPEDRTHIIDRVREQGYVQNFQVELRTRDGQSLWTEGSIWLNAQGIADGVLVDVTERRRLEGQVRQAQKLESLGVLAGGIAHDFNNILMGVLGNAELALGALGPDHEARNYLRDIESAAKRAADLCRQMLAYSGKGRFVVRPIDLSTLVGEMVHLLEVSITKKARLSLQLQEELPAVEADATQLRQVVMNLVTNASEALGDQSGDIAISTGLLQIDERHHTPEWIDIPLRPGPHVYLEVADTGCGMDQEVRSKIFEPFFTTKFTGRGLGMSAVLGIVRGHQGSIEIDSRPRLGSRFRVLLPALDQPAPQEHENSPPSTTEPARGRILLVDDESIVRKVGSEMLRNLGYEVDCACDGLEALECFDPEKHDAVLLDLTMPRMDGEECFRHLRRTAPELPILLSSGYNEQEILQRFGGRNPTGYIQKPYQLESLRQNLQQALNRRD